MALVLPSDLFRSGSAASVSGLSGTAASALAIGCTYLVGWVSEHYSFAPILLAASIIPLLGAGLVLLLVRNPGKTEVGFLKRI